MTSNWTQLLADPKNIIYQKCDIITRIMLRMTCKRESNRVSIINYDIHRILGNYMLHVAEGAAIFGYFSIVKEFYTDACDDIMQHSATGGCLNIFKWLHIEKNHVINIYATIQAAKSGHIDILKYAHKHNINLHTDIPISMASMNNQIDVIRWYISEGAKWSSLISDRLMSNGHFDTLKQLHQEGCPFLEISYKLLSKYPKDHEIWHWANDHICDHNRTTCITIEIKETHNPPSVIKPRRLVFTD